MQSQPQYDGTIAIPRDFPRPQKPDAQGLKRYLSIQSRYQPLPMAIPVVQLTKRLFTISQEELIALTNRYEEFKSCAFTSDILSVDFLREDEGKANNQRVGFWTLKLLEISFDLSLAIALKQNNGPQRKTFTPLRYFVLALNSFIQAVRQLNSKAHFITGVQSYIEYFKALQYIVLTSELNCSYLLEKEAQLIIMAEITYLNSNTLAIVDETFYASFQYENNFLLFLLQHDLVFLSDVATTIKHVNTIYDKIFANSVIVQGVMSHRFQQLLKQDTGTIPNGRIIVNQLFRMHSYACVIIGIEQAIYESMHLQMPIQYKYRRLFQSVIRKYHQMSTLSLHVFQRRNVYRMLFFRNNCGAGLYGQTVPNSPQQRYWKIVSNQLQKIQHVSPEKGKVIISNKAKIAFTQNPFAFLASQKVNSDGSSRYLITLRRLLNSRIKAMSEINSQKIQITQYVLKNFRHLQFQMVSHLEQLAFVKYMAETVAIVGDVRLYNAAMRLVNTNTMTNFTIHLTNTLNQKTSYNFSSLTARNQWGMRLITNNWLITIINQLMGQFLGSFTLISSSLQFRQIAQRKFPGIQGLLDFMNQPTSQNRFRSQIQPKSFAHNSELGGLLVDPAESDMQMIRTYYQQNRDQNVNLEAIASLAFLKVYSGNLARDNQSIYYVLPQYQEKRILQFMMSAIPYVKSSETKAYLTQLKNISQMLDITDLIGLMPNYLDLSPEQIAELQAVNRLQISKRINYESIERGMTQAMLDKIESLQSKIQTLKNDTFIMSVNPGAAADTYKYRYSEPKSVTSVTSQGRVFKRGGPNLVIFNGQGSAYTVLIPQGSISVDEAKEMRQTLSAQVEANGPFSMRYQDKLYFETLEGTYSWVTIEMINNAASYPTKNIKGFDPDRLEQQQLFHYSNFNLACDREDIKMVKKNFSMDAFMNHTYMPVSQMKTVQKKTNVDVCTAEYDELITLIIELFPIQKYFYAKYFYQAVRLQLNDENIRREHYKNIDLAFGKYMYDKDFRAGVDIKKLTKNFDFVQ